VDFLKFDLLFHNYGAQLRYWTDSAEIDSFKEKRDITIVQNTNNKRLLTTATPVFSEDNKIMRVIVNARDIKELDMVVDNKYFSDDKLKIKINDKNNHYNNMSHIVCKSDAMKRILKVADKIADTNSTVLITGPSGVGKEVIARYIHNLNKSRKDFIKINCGAIPEGTIDSELFGHEKGAFTGAHKLKEGKFIQAQKGTIFLDEIGTMPLNMQTKLLRVLEDRKVVRVGGEKEIPLDVRVIAATNENLSVQVEEKQFREDLFYRLNVVHINMPALNKRQSDIPLLAETFLEKSAKKNRKDIKGFSPEAMAKLTSYSWPGNIRELSNSIERAVILAKNEYIEAGDIVTGETYSSSVPEDLKSEDFRVESLKEIEKKAIINTLEAMGNNKSAAARELGITRKTLHKKLNEYKIDA
jgi:two-component system response regulator HydG